MGIKSRNILCGYEDMVMQRVLEKKLLLKLQ